MEEITMDATYQDLHELNSLVFKTSYVEHLIKTEKVSMADAFHRHLIAVALPTAKVFNRVMQKYGANPIGIEFRHTGRDAWAFVLPDVTEPEKTRIQYFDRNGFLSHFVCDSMQEAVETMIREDYQIDEPGILDTLSITDAWRIGTERAALVMKLNSGRISWAEFLAASGALV
jgi:hypothetical protein